MAGLFSRLLQGANSDALLPLLLSTKDMDERKKEALFMRNQGQARKDRITRALENKERQKEIDQKYNYFSETPQMTGGGPNLAGRALMSKIQKAYGYNPIKGDLQSRMNMGMVQESEIPELVKATALASGTTPERIWDNVNQGMALQYRFAPSSSVQGPSQQEKELLDEKLALLRKQRQGPTDLQMEIFRGGEVDRARKEQQEVEDRRSAEERKWQTDRDRAIGAQRLQEIEAGKVRGAEPTLEEIIKARAYKESAGDPYIESQLIKKYRNEWISPSTQSPGSSEFSTTNPANDQNPEKERLKQKVREWHAKNGMEMTPDREQKLNQMSLDDLLAILNKIPS